MPFLWRNKGFKLRLAIIVAFLLIPVTIVLNLGLPILFKQIINDLHDRFNTSESMILLLIFTYGFFWTLGSLITKLREMVFFRPIGHAITDYSLTVFKHIQGLSLKFHLGRQTGKITTAIDTAQLAIAIVITNILFRIAPIIIEILMAFIIIGYLYGSFYAAILICTVVTFIFWGMYAYRLELRNMRRWSELDGRATARLVDVLLNIETVNYFNRHDYETQMARHLNVLLGDLAVKNARSFSTILMVYAGIIATGLGLMAYYSAIDVIQHKLSLGDFILINSYVILFLGPLYDLTGHIYGTKYNLTKIEPSTELLKEETGVQTKAVLPELVITKAEISFDNVDFSYLPNHPLLRNLSFTVPSGSTIAIVGPSGCGKSTIARLLLRLFELNSGCIKIDNQDISKCDPNSIRQIIGCVPQDIALFNNTLRYNLCYGTFDCTDQEIDNIIRITHLDKFIKLLPLGLNTPVGERGLKLSGGERQRVALARALLKNPSIILMDEATSALDVKTEQAINENIEQIAKDITTIIIAHRLSTIVGADKIIVLDKGSIAEQGTHTQLLQQGGLYAALWRQQRHV